MAASLSTILFVQPISLACDQALLPLFKAIMLTGMGEKGLGHQGVPSNLIGQVFSHCLHIQVGVSVARADFADRVCEEAAEGKPQIQLRQNILPSFRAKQRRLDPDSLVPRLSLLRAFNYYV